MTLGGETSSFHQMWAQLRPIGLSAATGGYRRYAWTSADAECRGWFQGQATSRGLAYELDRNGNQWAWHGVTSPAEVAPGEAIVTSFMFVLLTPLAIAAALGVVAFLGAIGAGVLRAILPVRDVPDYIFLTMAYVVVFIGIFLARGLWMGPAYEFIGLIAKAILIATGPA